MVNTVVFTAMPSARVTTMVAANAAKALKLSLKGKAAKVPVIAGVCAFILSGFATSAFAVDGTILIDLLHFEAPYGRAGKWFNAIYLTGYLKKLLEQRNKTIKEIAETKMKDLNAISLEGAMKQVEGTARSMGINVVD